MSIPARDLSSAFEAWCAHERQFGRLRHRASEAVYRAMWQALVAWCGAQRPALRLADLHGTHLQRYLASRHGQQLADGVLTPRYQQRLVSLVDRVQAHRAWQRQQASANATQALALAVAAPPGHRPSPRLASQADSATEPPRHLLPAPRAVHCRPAGPARSCAPPDARPAVR